MSTFDAIENDGVCNIKYVQSERSAVEVSAPSNFMEHVVTDVDDGVLRIDYDGKHHSNNTDDIIIKVYSPTCKSIKNEGVGNITCDSLCADTLIVKNESVGSIELNKLAVSHLRVDNEDLGNVTITGKAETAKLINEGLGLIDVSGMECEDVGISNDGLGKVVTKTE